MNRRGFLGTMLAARAAPAIVRAGSLMKVREIIIPTTGEVYDINFKYFTAKDMSLSLDDFTMRYMRPAMAFLAEQIDMHEIYMQDDPFPIRIIEY